MSLFALAIDTKRRELKALPFLERAVRPLQEKIREDEEIARRQAARIEQLEKKLNQKNNYYRIKSERMRNWQEGKLQG